MGILLKVQGKTGGDETRTMPVGARRIGRARPAEGQLAPALAQGGPRVVVVRTDQRAEADLAARLRAVVADALT